MNDPIDPAIVEVAKRALRDAELASEYRMGLFIVDQTLADDAIAVVVSAVADDLRTEGAAEALHAALYELDALRANHDAAESAAPVPGEVGRQAAIDAWIAVCEEPAEWMRAFTTQYAHEAPSDEYVREQTDEARSEGRREILDALWAFRRECDAPLSVDLGNLVRGWLDNLEAGQS